FSISGRLYLLMIKRIPLFLGKNFIDQFTKVTNLLLNPKIETKWTNIQVSHAKNPFMWKGPISTIALCRPIVAIQPYSIYLNSETCWLFICFRMCLATYAPCC